MSASALLPQHLHDGMMITSLLQDLMQHATKANLLMLLDQSAELSNGMPSAPRGTASLDSQQQHCFQCCRDTVFKDLTEAHVQLWISCQLLHAVAQAHARGVCHGDIKCENVLVTSWSWAVLTDFAPYKPTYLPADNTVRIIAPCLSPEQRGLGLRCRS